MKCIVLTHEFKSSDNGNLYCKLEVRPANDDWAKPFNYVMFVTEAMQDALEANFPKFIYLEELRMKTPELFYRVWERDGPNYSQGELVSRPNKDDPDNPAAIVFNDFKIVIRTMPDGTPARGEDAEKILETQWNRGISNGTIIPLSAYGEDSDNSSTGTSADPFAGASTAGDIEPEPEVLEDKKQGVLPRPGLKIPGKVR